MSLDHVVAFWSRWETFTWPKLYWNKKTLHLLFCTTIHSPQGKQAVRQHISCSTDPVTSCMQRCQQSALFPLGTGCCRLLSHLHHLEIVHRDEGQFPVGQIHRTCSSWTLLSPQCSPGFQCVSRIQIKTAWWYDQRDLNTKKERFVDFTVQNGTTPVDDLPWGKPAGTVMPPNWIPNLPTQFQRGKDIYPTITNP